MKAFLPSLLALFAAAHFCFSAQLSHEEVFENSDLWPLRASVLEEANLGGGFPGVVIRIEPDGSALIDFGREGIVSKDIDETDILESASLIHSGERVKELPNFVYYTANMFVRHLGSEENLGISPEQMLQHDGLVLVYVNAETVEGASDLVAGLRSLNEQCLAANLLPLYASTDFQFYNVLPETGLAPLNMMLPHMSIGSLKMLSHQPDMSGALTVIRLDLNGKILDEARSTSSDENMDLLEEVAGWFSEG